jgi:hypothetical protein
VVLSIVLLFYGVAFAIAVWPRERRAKGEFREGDPDAWKDDQADEE